MSKEKKIEKARRQKDILYPVFQECLSLIKDDFWIKLFDDLSRGKCPKGVMLYNGVLNSTYKRNGFTYSFSEKTADIIVKEIPEILKKTVCIYSKNDIINKENDLSDANNAYSIMKLTDNWKKIKAKKMRENLITNFCLDMKRKYKMTYPNAKHLYDTIRDALYVYKTQKSDDINMKNGKIESIDDIEYSDKYGCFINLREIDETNSKKIKKNKNYSVLDNKWRNYLTIIVKEIVKNYSDE